MVSLRKKRRDVQGSPLLRGIEPKAWANRLGHRPYLFVRQSSIRPRSPTRWGCPRARPAPRITAARAWPRWWGRGRGRGWSLVVRVLQVPLHRGGACALEGVAITEVSLNSVTLRGPATSQARLRHRNRELPRALVALVVTREARERTQARPRLGVCLRPGLRARIGPRDGSWRWIPRPTQQYDGRYRAGILADQPQARCREMPHCSSVRRCTRGRSNRGMTPTASPPKSFASRPSCDGPKSPPRRGHGMWYPRQNWRSPSRRDRGGQNGMTDFDNSTSR